MNSILQSLKNRKRSLIAIFSLLVISGSLQNVFSQTVRSWNSGSGGAWLTGTNWTPSGNFAGNAPLVVLSAEGATTDIMSVAATNSASNVGINMNTLAAAGGVGLSMGGFDVSKTNTTALQIGNSSTGANGILQLNGATINSVANTFGRLSGSADFTIANVPSTGSQTMGLRLGITSGFFDVATGRTLTISSIISEASAGSGFTKTGVGTMTVSGVNTYTGATVITAGELRLNPTANNSLSGAATFNGGTLSTTGISASRAITFGSINLSDNSTLALLSGTAHTITFTSLGTLTAGKVLTITGWSGASYLTGTTTGTGGKVFIGSSNTLTDAQLSQIRFYNGTNYFTARQLATGELVPALNLIVTNPGNQTAGAPFSVTVTAKDYSGNATNMVNATGITLTSTGSIGGTTTGTIAAGTNSVTISGVTISAAGTGFTITATRSSGDQPITGTSGTFDVATAGAPVLVVSGTPTNHGTLCPGVSGSVVTYTITNNGTAASNVVVSSSDAQFVVSNLSSTSIGAAGTATYDVVFTPSSAGAKSATISVFYNTSTLSTTSSLTGTGTTPVTQAVSSAAATAITSAGATLNGNVTTLGVCPATIEKGFVYSVTATNAAPAVGGTGVTKTLVASVATGTYSLALTGLPSSTGYSFAAYVYDGTTYTYGTVLTFSTAGALAVSGTTAHGSICPAVSATPQTYTITNSGGVTAAGISVVSSDPQFVVSALSSTSIAGSGGTATYVVTFTPSASGAQSAVITVSSTTGGIASVTSNLTGTGITPVTPVFATAAASSIVNTTATLNGSVTTLGVCPATTQKGFVYAETAVNADPLNAGTGVTTTVVGSPSTGAYTLGLTGLTPLTGYTYKAFVFDGTTYTYGSPVTFTTLGVATQLAFGTAPPSTGSVATNLTTFTVQALRANSTVDAEYTGSVTLTRNIVSGSATLTGTVTVTAVAGVATFSAAQFSAVGTYTITAASGVLTTVTSSNITITLANSTLDPWVNTGASTAWHTAANWNAGVPSGAVVAQWNNTGTATSSGINLGTGAPSILGIEITSLRTRSLLIGASSSTSGDLTLNGGVINGIPNVILASGSNSTFTIQPTQASSGLMAVALGNTTENIVNITGTGDIIISAVISGSGKLLTKAGAGSGSLVLSGANTFTGLTTVSAGTLQLNRTGGTTIPITNSITVNGGTLKVTTNQTIANLTMSSGSLVIDAGATLTITGTYNVTGGTIDNLGTLNLNGGAVTFPGTGVTINNGTAGTMAALTIASSGTVTLNDNLSLTGTLTLTSGTLAIGANTLTLGGAVSRTTGNLAGGNTSTLVVNGTAGSLFFASGSTNNYLKAFTIGASGSATLGNALNITAYDGSSTEGVLTVTSGGTLTTGGFLTLKSDANGTARIAAGNTAGSYISGSVTVERFIRQNTNKGWRLLGTNTSGSQTINAAWQEGAIGGMVNPNPGFGTKITKSGGSVATAQTLGFDSVTAGTSLYKYDAATDNLVAVPNTNSTVLSSEQGYFLFIRGDRSPGQFGTGAPTTSTTLRSTGAVLQGDQSAVSTGALGWGLVRNPYPSRINMLQIVRSGISDAYQVWDPKLGGSFGVGGYQTFTKALAGPNTGNYEVAPGGGSYGSIGSVNNFIESGAAFFIQGSGSAQVVEAAKETGSNNASFRPSSPLSGSERFTFNVYANNSGNFDMVDGGYVDFDNSFSNDIDINDVRKSLNFGENFGILRNATDLVVERRQLVGANDTLYFKMNQLRQITYRIDMAVTNIDPLITAAELQDKYTGVNTPLDLSGSMNSYAFTIDATAASKAADRFKVVFRQSSVVPVSFVSVKAAQAGRNIAVEWKVANQVNVTRYEVEKSADGRSFSNVGTIVAGNVTTYNWLDENVVAGNNYYRIKSVDNNGQVKYTAIVRVAIGKAGAITVSPNPVQGNVIHISFADQKEGAYSVRLINITGQSVYNRIVEHAGGSASQIFALPSGLVSGVYQLEIIAPDSSRQVEKLIVNAGN